jgi:hypothetical protein
MRLRYLELVVRRPARQPAELCVDGRIALAGGLAQSLEVEKRRYLIRPAAYNLRATNVMALSQD